MQNIFIRQNLKYHLVFHKCLSYGRHNMKLWFKNRKSRIAMCTKLNIKWISIELKWKEDFYPISSGSSMCKITPLHVLNGSLPEISGSMLTLAPTHMMTASYSPETLNGIRLHFWTMETKKIQIQASYV